MQSIHMRLSQNPTKPALYSQKSIDLFHVLLLFRCLVVRFLCVCFFFSPLSNNMRCKTSVCTKGASLTLCNVHNALTLKNSTIIKP